MKVYKVFRKEYNSSNELVGTSLVGIFDSYDEADDKIQSDISDFREYHDNDERIDAFTVCVYDDIGNCNRFEWDITEQSE